MNKYIRQQVLRDFVYPNSEVSQYDTELIHNINNNLVTGVINTFDFVSGTTTGITFTINVTSSLNGADPVWNNVNEGNRNLVSIHGLAPGQDYYKPWRTLRAYEFSGTVDAVNIALYGTFTPNMFGITAFTSGVYYFEFRFISKRNVYVIMVNKTITIT